jgi:hypothetical protein
LPDSVLTLGRALLDYYGMETKVAKLESVVEYIQRDILEIKTEIREIRKDARSDFYLLFGALIVGALGLAGLMAKGFHWF